MNIIGIAIGVTGLLLLGMFMWMLALSVRKKRLEQERKQREIAHRKAIERNRRQEHQERIAKAEGGDIPTILFMGKEAERKNPKEAIYWYTKAAKLDSVMGMYGIVRISNKMQQDVILKEQARFWQTCINASEGSLPHKFEMAQALIHGRGTEINTPKALMVMEQAAKENYVDALVFLGDWWAPDNNNDPTKSTSYYRRATELKSNEGRMKLGLNYINGVGVASNFARGCYWLERAGEKGHLEAMYKAGEIWMGQKPNGNAISYIWLFLAAQLGHEPSRALRDQVALQIGVDTVVGLQSLSKPMLKKIRENKVGKHSIIKALNKLYKRGIPVDDDGTVPVDSNVIEPTKEESQVEKKLDFSQSPMDKQ
ncbi:tetratricopeptide repeat protein [Vibrio sp. TBV020]|uniref:tetratricopeptide repeat protein n=1 Tax=Vibrio sp. TBV020 TaxID=3137398 RepID=UPI0038CDB637